MHEQCIGAAQNGLVGVDAVRVIKGIRTSKINLESAPVDLKSEICVLSDLCVFKVTYSEKGSRGSVVICFAVQVSVAQSTRCSLPK